MSERPDILYATSNRGKQAEVGAFLAEAGWAMRTPQELGIEIDVPETGSTLEANATLKAEAYRSLAPELIVLADDTGLEIDALGGEPGVYVRRWRDHVHEMTDEEIITYCLQRMRDVPEGQRGAQFRTVIAIAVDGQPITTVDGLLRGELLTHDTGMRLPGLPFGSLLYSQELGMLLGEYHRQRTADAPDPRSHRTKAIAAALAWLESDIR